MPAQGKSLLAFDSVFAQQGLYQSMDLRHYLARFRDTIVLREEDSVDVLRRKLALPTLLLSLLATGGVVGVSAVKISTSFRALEQASIEIYPQAKSPRESSLASGWVTDSLVSPPATGDRPLEAQRKLTLTLLWVTFAVFSLSLVGVVTWLVQKIAVYFSDRKQMEAKLLQEKEFAQTTLDSLAEGVITLDAQGLVQSINPIAQLLTGWSSIEAQNRPLSEVFLTIDEETAKTIDLGLEQILQGQERLGDHRQTQRLISRMGDEFAIDDSLVPIRDRRGTIQGAVLTFRDVTQARQMERQLCWQVSHDPLTELANRSNFESHLQRAILQAKENNLEHSVCILDLDCFKLINDSCGHLAGDRLLCQIGQLLREKVRRSDVVARLGGDEFAILLYQCSGQRALAIAQDLCRSIQSLKFFWSGQMFSVSASLGIAPVRGHEASVGDVISTADVACYTAKRQGRGRVYACKGDDQAIAQQREEIQWIARIQQALTENRFCLYFQTIAPLQTHHPASEHYEVLIRLRDEAGRIISPAAFMPAAERYNLMPVIDRWVITTLFSTQGEHYRQAWERCRQEGGECVYAINLSGSSINDDQFIHFVREQIARYQIPPQVLCFEVTETVAIANLQKAAEFIQDLRRLGCKFSLDDFGTGMSSLAYLKNLPIDYLKIDGCFVKDIVEDPVAQAMVEAISQIGRVMGIQTITEFVSSDAIFAKVCELGVDYAQGYNIAEPRPLVAVLGQNGKDSILTLQD